MTVEILYAISLSVKHSPTTQDTLHDDTVDRWRHFEWFAQFKAAIYTFPFIVFGVMPLSGALPTTHPDPVRRPIDSHW